jgi:rubredoxin
MSQVPMKNLFCPMCGGETERGFVMDRMQGGQKPAEWIAGAPVPSFWRGTDVSATAHRVLEAFRCRGCGYVMLFARDQA